MLFYFGWVLSREIRPGISLAWVRVGDKRFGCYFGELNWLFSLDKRLPFLTKESLGVMSIVLVFIESLALFYNLVLMGLSL